MGRNKYKLPAARFYLEPPKEGESLIIMKATYRGLRLVYSTGFKIAPELWDKERWRAFPRKKGSRGITADILRINKELDHISQIVADIYVEFDYGEISRKQYKLELAYRLGHKQRPKEEEKTLLTFIPAYIKQAKEKRNLDEKTCMKYQTFYNQLLEYCKAKRKELDFDDIDWDFRNSFEQWFYNHPKAYSQNTVSKAFDNLKLVMREAYRRGIHGNTAFMDQGFGVKRIKTRNKVRFTFEELRSLYQYDFSDTPRLERVRDVFILAAYTGPRFSDWKKIKKENISTDEDGYQFLEYVAEKTNTYIVVGLGKVAISILQKYDYAPPAISHQRFNDYIKEVVKIVLPKATYQAIYSEGGQTKHETRYKWQKVSTHAARRSFATNFYEKGNHSVFDLMQMTGHSTEKQFFAYIDVTPMQSAKRFARIDKIMREEE